MDHVSSGSGGLSRKSNEKNVAGTPAELEEVGGDGTLVKESPELSGTGMLIEMRSWSGSMRRMSSNDEGEFPATKANDDVLIDHSLLLGE